MFRRFCDFAMSILCDFIHRRILKLQNKCHWHLNCYSLYHVEANSFWNHWKICIQNTENPPTKVERREAALLVWYSACVMCRQYSDGEVETAARLVHCTGQTSENRRRGTEPSRSMKFHNHGRLPTPTQNLMLTNPPPTLMIFAPAIQFHIVG